MDNGKRQHSGDLRPRKLGVMSVFVLLCGLSGCDRPGVPPSPVDPARPKMFRQEHAVELGPAIFHYVRPPGGSAATRLDAPPAAAGGRLQV